MTFEQRLGSEMTESAAWLKSQRWYGDKARELKDVTIDVAAIAHLEAEHAALLIVRCAFTEGEDARYFVPVAGLTHEAVLDDSTPSAALTIRDALRDSSFLAWFFEGFRQERVGKDGGLWRWRLEPGAVRDLATIDELDTHLMSVEQSNTSILYDHRVMAKVFRRVQTGINPDLEVTEYVTMVAGFAHVPKLYGVFSLELENEELTLGVLQQFVGNVGDGWTWLLRELRNLTPDHASELAEQIGLLGTRTGELHVALGASAENAAFTPEVMTSVQVESLQSGVASELDETISSLRTHGNKNEDELAQLDEKLRSRISEATALIGTLTIRVHGDYHLGQVLRTLEHDFAIIDFEGEPSRSIEQRRQKFSPLRDVAGMLRSLDYAAGAIDREINDASYRKLVQQWGVEARKRFLAAYQQAIAAGDSRLVPQSSHEFDSALHILEIEKSLYEARYELNNRPDWLVIPWNALNQLGGS